MEIESHHEIRGIFFAMTAGGVQLLTLAVAVAVVRHRAQRTARVAILLYGAITVLLLADGGPGEVQLLLNLIALVVAGVAISAELLVARHPRAERYESRPSSRRR